VAQRRDYSIMVKKDGKFYGDTALKFLKLEARETPNLRQ